MYAEFSVPDEEIKRWAMWAKQTNNDELDNTKASHFRNWPESCLFAEELARKVSGASAGW